MMSLLPDRIGRCRLVACFVLLVLVAQAPAAPRFGFLETGTFGLPLTDSWANSSFGQTLNSLDDAYSISFTALENLTVDRAMQRFVGVDPGTTLRIGIQADNGSGAPSGTFLGSAVVNPADGDTTTFFSFGSVSLIQGTVYHLVTEPVTLGPSESMVVFSGHTNNTFRPYDRTTDLAHRGNFRTNGGAWTPGTDPFVVFANGSDTSFVPQMSQPYGHMGASITFTQGGGGGRTGTTFKITEGEVAAGETVRIKEVSLPVIKNVATPGLLFTMAIRNLSGTILGSVTVPVSEIPAGSIQLKRPFDAPIDLLQGVEYLFTTHFSAGSTASDFMFLPVAFSPVGGDAGWLGRIATTAANDLWLTHSTSGSIGDLPVTLIGRVPEPTALGLLLVGGFIAFRRVNTTGSRRSQI